MNSHSASVLEDRTSAAPTTPRDVDSKHRNMRRCFSSTSRCFSHENPLVGAPPCSLSRPSDNLGSSPKRCTTIPSSSPSWLTDQAQDRKCLEDHRCLISKGWSWQEHHSRSAVPAAGESTPHRLLTSSHRHSQSRPFFCPSQPSHRDT